MNTKMREQLRFLERGKRMNEAGEKAYREYLDWLVKKEQLR